MQLRALRRVNESVGRSSVQPQSDDLRIAKPRFARLMMIDEIPNRHPLVPRVVPNGCGPRGDPTRRVTVVLPRFVVPGPFHLDLEAQPVLFGRVLHSFRYQNVPETDVVEFLTSESRRVREVEVHVGYIA